VPEPVAALVPETGAEAAALAPEKDGVADEDVPLTLAVELAVTPEMLTVEFDVRSPDEA